MFQLRILPLFLLLLLASLQPAKASDFQNWVSHFRAQALAKGITPAVFDTAFQTVTPIQRVIDLDRKQPERTKMGFSTYLKNVMNQARIDNGREGLEQNRTLLNSVSTQFGVPAEVIVALWGIETSYGSNTGGYDLLSALATLAWEGRRAKFFENELINALLILQGGHIERQDFKGSWAGAMGQNQFMPSSWQSYAVDFNGDTHKDIWNTKADVFASSANYLHKNGWDPELKWGWAIERPNNTANTKRSYIEWLQSGIHFKETPPSIPSTTPLTLVIPDGGDGRAYLVTKNFNVIMSWNKSTYFALTVGLLSDYVAKSQPKTVMPQPAFNE